MFDDDLESFQSMLDSVNGLISRGKYTPNAEASALFFNALQAYDLATVSAAFTAHVKDPVRGKFAPTPADLIAQIDAAYSDGRPGADEAWAMTPASEEQTVVWTNEMAEAYHIAAPLLLANDKVGARFAFREAYDRIVARAKREGRRPTWEASLGSHFELRKQALQRAVEQGKLTAEYAHDQCPALPPPAAKVLALTNDKALKPRDVRKATSELAKAFSDEPKDPKAWARELKRRDEAGEPITLEQREAYRRALHYALDEGVLFAAMTTIPNHCLPPGMRKHRGDPRPLEEA